MAQSAVKVEGLRKRFGAVVALDGIDLEVPLGSCLRCWAPMGRARRRWFGSP
jgi:ABC-type branched-subunit amino acid transport system ATPase component